MEISAAIAGRRTIKDFKPDAVPDDLLKRVLTAGLWGQNHKMTEPWRFTVAGPETHRQLAEIEGKVAAKPLVVAVCQRLAGDESTRREDYAAIACAIQNIQLAAWAEGLGMQWSSGKLTRLEAVDRLFDVDREKEDLVGLLYFGYPSRVPVAQPRKPLAEVMRRLP